MKLFKKLYKKIFGELKYRVQLLTMYGEVTIHEFDNIKGVNKFIEGMNEPEFYQYNIVKIDKLRFFTFTYNKKIIHRKLGFCAKSATEIVNIDDHDYSYPKIETNLINVVRDDN